MLGRWEASISDFKVCLADDPDQVGPRVYLAVDYMEVGREQAARAELAEALRLFPTFSLKIAVNGDWFTVQKERAVADLRKAGLN